jgi:hypothetical protein
MENSVDYDVPRCLSVVVFVRLYMRVCVFRIIIIIIIIYLNLFRVRKKYIDIRNGLDVQSIFFVRNVLFKAVLVFVTEGNIEQGCQPASDFTCSWI